MIFRVDPAAFDLFPGMRLALAVASDLDNRAPRPLIAARLAEAWAGVREKIGGSPQDHPRIRPWRDAFRRMGVSGKEFPSSVEALARRALRQPEPVSISPLVDLYNAVSLALLVPAGGFDLDRTSGDLVLGFTAGGEAFQAIGDAAAEAAAPGEVAIRDGASLLTRHYVWRQHARSQITPDTRRVFLIAEVLGPVGAGVADEAAAAFAALLAEGFGAAPRTAIAEAARPAVEL